MPTSSMYQHLPLTWYAIPNFLNLSIASEIKVVVSLLYLDQAILHC